MEESLRESVSNINPIPNNDKSQLTSLHQGGSFIIRLNNPTSGDQASQIYPNYLTQAIESPVKIEAGNEIAFEIIQEPLLNDNDNTVIIENNRLFFETDDSFDKITYHNKEHQKSLSANNIGEVVAIRPDKKQETQFLNSPLKEELSDTNCNRCDVTFSSSLKAPSQNVSLLNKSTKAETQDSSAVASKDAEVIKKTMVEAFVKMIVCRKITVEKQNAKTGDIMDVDVKLEEDEPVILGVDYVETTEDIISGQVSRNSSDTSKPTCAGDSNSSVKVLKVMPDNSGKISKGILSNSVLQSTLQKGISKVLNMDTNFIVTEKTSNNDENNMLNTFEDCTDNIDNDSDSTDFNQQLTKKSIQPEQKANKSVNDMNSSTKFNEENSKSSSALSQTKKDNDDNISIPKKRGRKRKWDKTIGLAPKLKTCQFCFKSFDCVSSCQKHMKKGSCVSSQYCFLCSKTFDSESQLEKHIASHRDENKNPSFDCNDCLRSYRTKAGFNKHFKMGTCKRRENYENGETGDFSCELCDSRFSTLDYLHLHQYKVHENPKDKHFCSDCGKTFYSSKGFQRHRSGRPCTEPLKCHICGKTYKAKESFKLHMKHHKSEISGQTYNCDECGRSYMTESSLTKHKHLHTGVKPYKCDVCGKDFAMRYQVKEHARMHTGEKPYSCNLCGVAFSNKGHLGRHVRSHENGTLFRRGRPKKSQNPPVSSNTSEREIKLIELGQTLQTMDGQTIQVVDGQIFKSQGDGPPMIIQADTNTIIIAEGWQDNSISASQATVVGGSGNAS